MNERETRTFPHYVPLSIRSRSKVVTWAWKRPWLARWLTYERAQWLARRLP